MTNDLSQTLRHTGIPMLAYTVVLFACGALLRHHPDTPWQVPIALMPVVPLIFLVWNGVKRMRQIDELQQRIALEGAVFANRAMFLLCVSLGFLQRVGLPQVHTFFFAVAIAVLGMLGTAIARWNYR